MNFRGGSFKWKSKVLVPFLRVKSDQRATSLLQFSGQSKVLVHFLRFKSDQRETSLPTLFPPNPSDENLEIAIL